MNFLGRIFGSDYENDASVRRGAPKGQRIATARRDAEIKRAAESGATPLQIASQFGVGRQTVYLALQREGFSLFNDDPPKNSPRYHFKARKAEIVQKYKAGFSAEAIGQEYGITRERVCQILRPLNLTNLKAEQKRLARETIESERETIIAELKATRTADINRAVEIVRAGGSRNDAIRETGLPAHAVTKACAEAGVPYSHGRWHRTAEFEERKAKIHALRADGNTWQQIGTSHYQWAIRHMPELFQHKWEKAAKPKPEINGFAVPRARKAAIKLNPDADWTPELVATLCRMYFDGCSAQQIADVLGHPFTRNSIIGKTNRLRAAKLLQPPAEKV